MTLALYGKSKRRQVALLALGCLTAASAALLALSWLGSDGARAADTDWKSPAVDGSSTLNSSVANNGFTNGDRAKTQNSQFAYTPTSLQRHSYGSFGFTGLDGYVVVGIEVRLDVWTRTATNTTCQVVVRLWRDGKGGADRWSAGRSVTLPPSTDTDTYVLFGSDDDLWGEPAWQPSDFANATFLADIEYVDPGTGCTSGGASGGIAVDHIQVRVHYTTPEPPDLPDLIVSKDAIRAGLPISSITDDQDFRWRWTISNEGEADALFQSGQVVLRDELPAGLAYSSPSDFGAVACNVVADVFTCLATGSLTIPPDQPLQVSLGADPSSGGMYINTTAGCRVDYLADTTGGNVAESDETNNTCQSDVTVQVIERRHPRVCLRLVDDGDAFPGETATIVLAFDNVTTGLPAGGSTKTYTEAPEADALAAGECSDLNYFPIGTVIKVTPTITAPSDAVVVGGYPVALLIPGADPNPPSPTVEFTVGDGNCGGPTNGESVRANDTCNLHLYVKLAPAEPEVELPTVRKVPANPPIADGKARWDIIIDQPDENWADQTVVISDAHADIELVGTPPCTVNNGEIVCAVGEHDLSFTVARPIDAATLASGTLCAGGTIANHLLGASAGGEALTVTGGISPAAIDVRDTSTCAPPEVTKTFVAGGSASVTEPEEVRWLITVDNPAGGLDNVSVTVRDTDAALVVDSGTSNPSGNLETWCDVGAGPTFDATCVLPPDSSVTFVVVPAEAPLLQCASAQYPNAAEFAIGGSDEWTNVLGPTITLLGATSECPQDITIVKRLVNVPVDAEIDTSTDLPTLTVPDGTYVSGPTALGANEWAWVYTVPPHYAGTVTETVPTGWEAVPCESGADGAYTTFCNQPLVSIAVTKSYAPNGGPDATDDDVPLSIVLEGHGAFVPAGPTLNNETSYQPRLVSAGRYTVTETLAPIWHPIAATVAGIGCLEVVPGDLFEAFEEELIRAIELLQFKHSITFDANPGAECTVTFTNERLVATVVVEKLYFGAVGDVPALTMEVDSSNVEGTWAESGSPTNRWQRLVPVKSDGSVIEVTESLAAGWANAGAFVGSCGEASAGSAVAGTTATVSAADVQPGATVTVCFVNVAVGAVQIIKLDATQSGEAQTWDFASDAPGVSGPLTTPDDEGVTQAQRSIQLVPTGEYTISELQGRGECIAGAVSSDFQTEAAAHVGEPPADDELDTIVGNGPLAFVVEKGQTTYIRFDNRGCGTVLGTGLIVVWKYADYDGDGIRDAGEPPVPGWHFSVEGPDGSFDVATDSEGKHVFTVAKGGTYTITEEPRDGWRVIGSMQGAAFTPGRVAEVHAGLGQHREVAFFNQPRVSIVVTKSEVSSAFPTGTPGEGWEFTLTGCGIESRVETTGADGTLLFADLPPAVGCTYTVAETPVDGWAPVTATRTASPDEAGETVTLGFRNIRIETCEACAPAGPINGTTPTPTSTPAMSPTPAGTPLPASPSPTATGTPVPAITSVAGERTPGPDATPLPPDTGHGNVHGGGASLLLWLAGSAAVATGLLFLRASRRRDS